jgi:hypothetical protein
MDSNLPYGQVDISLTASTTIVLSNIIIIILNSKASFNTRDLESHPTF